MITTALFDIDGVILKKRKEYFSILYAREKGVPEEKIKTFFENEFQQCLVGERDIKEILPKYLKEWKWEKSVDDFLQYWFDAEKQIDLNVMKQVEKLRESNIECYLASQQEKYRAAYILRNEGLVDKVDGAFFSCILGSKKDTPRFFKKILTRLGVPAEEVVFWDDENENIIAAREVGITAYSYNDFDTFEKEVKAVLVQNKN